MVRLRASWGIVEPGARSRYRRCDDVQASEVGQVRDLPSDAGRPVATHDDAGQPSLVNQVRRHVKMTSRCAKSIK